MNSLKSSISKLSTFDKTKILAMNSECGTMHADGTVTSTEVWASVVCSTGKMLN